MFVDRQRFAGSWGPKFMNIWFVALQCMAIHELVKGLLSRLQIFFLYERPTCKS